MYIPFLSYTMNSLIETLKTKVPFMVIQRFTWPGIESVKGFMVSMYDDQKTAVIGANAPQYHKMNTEKILKISWSSYEQLDEKSMLELLTSYEYADSAVPNVWKKKRRKKRR